MLKKHVIAALFACTLVSTNAQTTTFADQYYLYEDWGFVEEKLLLGPNKTPWLIKLVPWLTGTGMVVGGCYLTALSFIEPRFVNEKRNLKKIVLSAASLLAVLFSLETAYLAKDGAKALYKMIQKPAYNAIKDYTTHWLEYRDETPSILHPIFNDAHEKHINSSNPEEYIAKNYMRILRQVAHLYKTAAVSCRPA